jgi:EAL domain-containing protein (putative c-di-GMP-specific phosphodiesterase class I)/GGDEF domain-containing protein
VISPEQFDIFAPLFYDEFIRDSDMDKENTHMAGKDANDITYDSMTGLKDRVTFFADVRRSAAAGQGRDMVLVQLTQLMRINRKHGATVGDGLLRAIAGYLGAVDPAYSAYRIANSRLTLLGPEGDGAQMEELTARIQKRFQEPWPIEDRGELHEVQAKAFVVHFPLKLRDTENDLVDKMNYAVSVFQAKAREGVLFFGEGLNEDMLYRRYVMEEVRYAVERGTFQIYYQPIYDCVEGRFTSAESLVRLVARDGAFLFPGEFIPMAEENGLIDGISWIVLEKVCRFLGGHPGLPIGTVSVNMTGQQILDPTFIRRIEENLERYRLDGSRLRIEITERTVTDDFAEVRKVMECLAAKGIQFYLDDFGTGYSNLASVLALPFEVIKFDQSLIRMMVETDKGLKTIGLLAEIMHENDCSIVAEGVETEVQVRSAQERRLDRIQGFYYAKPMPEEDLMVFLENMRKNR